MTTTGDANTPTAIPWWRAGACGACMGLADAVPGVSGGTVLLLLGMLEPYLAALAAVLALGRRPLSGQAWRTALSAFRLLGPLVCCQALALISGIFLLVGHKPDLGGDAEAVRAAIAEAPGLLVNPGTAPIVYALFFGMVAATVREPWRERRTKRGVDWLAALVGAALAAGLSLSPAASGTPSAWLLIVGGAVAISVMILPGVSGSLALLVLGLYQPVASALHAREVLTILWFLIGIGLGLAIAVPALRTLLARAHDRTMAFLTGLMAGSLVALWPWKAHYLPEAIPLLGPMTPRVPAGAWWWPILAAVLGGGLLLILVRVMGRRDLAKRP